MDKFLENFHDLLEETEKEQITPETEFKNLDEWDSMTALMLIAMFDEQYGKKINGDNIKSASTLSDLYALTQN
ncbi:acyl carrier protein [Elizabethkingia anophelis]|uniref:Acyl carrier protein n=1 Tax=Elizabethkingia anophelis R26 TaxID=1246994 RepID=A0ABN5BWP4_9FLAO|nr:MULTISPECIES: acyl carrier protein [Elizabethkingia]ATC36121.1 acyl carrier protein [Elizabethkingia anophelis R26]ATC39798.1 acyl carrier protein [Elizabethkingia anophelis Ag1]ATC43477.1 acyl carrier protein [Elizabethkingia anophelis]ATC47153.1 acyl carrier protein [Elizabethkingia anophelis]ELR80716.1 acyl carrier protein-like protein [Elizabethkingia anophelis R26]